MVFFVSVFFVLSIANSIIWYVDASNACSKWFQGAQSHYIPQFGDSIARINLIHLLLTKTASHIRTQLSIYLQISSTAKDKFQIAFIVNWITWSAFLIQVPSATIPRSLLIKFHHSSYILLLKELCSIVALVQ